MRSLTFLIFSPCTAGFSCTSLFWLVTALLGLGVVPNFFTSPSNFQYFVKILFLDTPQLVFGAAVSRIRRAGDGVGVVEGRVKAETADFSASALPSTSRRSESASLTGVVLGGFVEGVGEGNLIVLGVF